MTSRSERPGSESPQRPAGEAKTERRRTSALRRAELDDEAGFVRRSIEDLDRELATGDLDGADYEQLRARYEGRAAAVAEALQQLETDPGVPPAPPPLRRRLGLASRRHRLGLGWAAAGSFAMAGVLLGLGIAGVAPFERSSPPLSAQTRISIELAEATVLASHGHIASAVDTYEKVLAIDPEQPVALTDDGWLVRVSGLSSSRPSLVSQGDREIAAAVAVDPGYAVARAYDGVALLEDDHDPRAAVEAFQVMLADHPSAALVRSVRAQVVKAYGDVHEPVPAAAGH